MVAWMVAEMAAEMVETWVAPWVGRMVVAKAACSVGSKAAQLAALVLWALMKVEKMDLKTVVLMGCLTGGSEVLERVDLRVVLWAVLWAVSMVLHSVVLMAVWTAALMVGLMVEPLVASMD